MMFRRIVIINIIIAAFFMLAFQVMAQGSRTFGYQVVMEDEAGRPLANQQIQLLLSITKGKRGPVIWQEQFNTKTKANGLATVSVGHGPNLVPPGGNNMAVVDWSQKDLWVRINMGGASGKELSLLPLSTLPYALVALNSGSSDIVGAIVASASDTSRFINPGWAVCDGRELPIDGFDPVTKIPYSRLYNVIGSAFGSSNPGFFRLPDLRGRFPRGVDEEAKQDSGANARQALYVGGASGARVGSYQQDHTGSHSHKYFYHKLGNVVENPSYGMVGAMIYTPGDTKRNTSPAIEWTAPPPATQSNTHGRPKNVAVFYLIKL